MSTRLRLQPVYSPEDSIYCYPNSGTLKNLLDIRGASELAESEAYLVALRIADALRAPRGFTFSFGYLKALHKRLFQDVYEWAGATRRVNMSKGATRFAVWEQIDDEPKRLFAATAVLTLPLHVGLRPWFSDTASHFLIELNVIHPFREGNGRTIRVFAEL